MARDESNREDLLGESTALVERIELAPKAATDSIASESAGRHVVAGFRADGALSIFFGEDPVYQFNAAGQIRRAYCDGLLFKAVHGQLITLNRIRTQHEVQLIRRDLTSDETVNFVQRMEMALRKFESRLASDFFSVVGQVPADSDVLNRLRLWLAARTPAEIADRPNA